MELALNATELRGVVDTVRRKTRATQDDAEDAVQTALTEWLEQGPDCDIDLTQPFGGVLVQRAIWRIGTKRQLRESRNTSLEALEEESEDCGPKSVAVTEDDLDSRLKLAEINSDPVLRKRAHGVASGGSRHVQARGEAHQSCRYSDRVVAEARRLRKEEKRTYREIAAELGCHKHTASQWCKGTIRKTTMRGWDRQTIVAALKDWSRRNGRPPRYEEVAGDLSLPAIKSIALRFGTFNAALSAAGLETYKHVEAWSREGADAAFLEFTKCHGHFPSLSEFRERGSGLPAYGVLKRLYGTYSLRKIQQMVNPKPERSASAAPTPGAD